jgi:serine/arginine repetitive matrix protein 2
MLEQSKQEYGPLSSEFRPRRVRSRTSSRPSPYPIRRPFSRSPEKHIVDNLRPSSQEPSVVSSALRQISINPNANIFTHPSTFEKLLSCEVETETSKPAKAILTDTRPRVSSSARRAALGWSKRSTGRSNKSNNANKENSNKENASQGLIT